MPQYVTVIKGLTLTITTIFLALQTVRAQPCTNLGQTPATAFPVCGTDVFSQSSVPACSNQTISTFCPPDPLYPDLTYGDLNPYWYKFTCFESGTLGFLINPNNNEDDYDWILYDVTDRDISKVYTDKSSIVAYNWSGEHGNTGSSSAGNSLFVCATTPTSDYRPLFTQMPNLIEGHQYLLMISHFTGDQQSGYKLSFGGGTASITDTTQPALKAIKTNCDATQLRIKLNKKMKCPSLVIDGSDFILSPGNITITNAVAASCTRGFDMDSVILDLSGPLPDGDYTLTAVDGTDGNTLKDNCDRTIPVGSALSFTVTTPQPSPLDSLIPLKCAANQLHFVFDRPIHCNSIAANGSDFIVTGPTPVTVSSASGDCTDGLSSTITIQLASPLYTGGVYQVQLVRGTDGNTILNECDLETPALQTISFTIKDTVSAAFTYTIDMGCKRDTINYVHNGNNGVTQWLWNFDNTDFSSSPTHAKDYPAAGQFTAQLTVTNGFCTDSSSVNIALDNLVSAAFTAPDILCPEDSASFINNSTGPIDSWNWTFGDGHTSTLQSPAEKYPMTGKETNYTVGLTVHSPVGCTETVSKTLRVLGSCYIAVPSAFTPNNDGKNDYLYPLNALKADNLNFRIFNRWGQLVFHSNNWLSKWDGTINGTPQATGTYVWILQFTHHDTGKKVEMKGTSTLIR